MAEPDPADGPDSRSLREALAELASGLALLARVQAATFGRQKLDKAALAVDLCELAACADRMHDYLVGPAAAQPAAG